MPVTGRCRPRLLDNSDALDLELQCLRQALRDRCASRIGCAEEFAINLVKHRQIRRIVDVVACLYHVRQAAPGSLEDQLQIVDGAAHLPFERVRNNRPRRIHARLAGDKDQRSDLRTGAEWQLAERRVGGRGIFNHA